MGSKGIVSVVVIVGGQGWAATVLNKNHCDFVPKSAGNFFLFVCFEVLSLDIWNARISSVPDRKKDESPEPPPGTPTSFSA